MRFVAPSAETYGPETPIFPQWAHKCDPIATNSSAFSDLTFLRSLLEKNQGKAVTAVLAKEIGRSLSDFAATIEGDQYGYLHHCAKSLNEANRLYLDDGSSVTGYRCNEEDRGRYRRQMFLTYGWRLLSAVQASIQTDARFFCTRSGGGPTLGCSVLLSLRTYLDKMGCFSEHLYDMDTDRDTACYAMDVFAFVHLLFATKCLIVQLDVIQASMDPAVALCSYHPAGLSDLRCPTVVHPSVEYTFSFFLGSREDLEAQSDAMGAHLLFPATWDEMWPREESGRSLFYDAHDFYNNEILALQEEARLIREANVRHLRNVQKKKKKCVYTGGRPVKKGKSVSP